MRNTGGISSDDNYLTHPEDRPRLEAALQRLQRGDIPRYSEPLRLRHRDGHPIACQVYLAHIGAKGPRRQILCQLHELQGAPPVSTDATRGNNPPEIITERNVGSEAERHQIIPQFTQSPSRTTT